MMGTALWRGVDVCIEDREGISTLAVRWDTQGNGEARFIGEALMRAITGFETDDNARWTYVAVGDYCHEISVPYSGVVAARLAELFGVLVACLSERGC